MSSIAKVVGAPRAPTVWERLSARYGTPIYVPGGPLAQSLPTERQGCNPSFTSQVARDRLEARVRKFSARVDELSVQVNEETRARHLEAFRCVPLQQRPEPLPARKRWEPSIGLSQSIRDAEQRIKDSREKCRQTDIRVNERIARWNQRKLERGSQVPLQQQPEPLPARQDGCRTSISERRELTARRINASRQQVASQHHPALSVKSSAVEGFMPPRMRKTVGNQEVKEVKEPSLARQDRCRTSISERRELTARRINASHQQVASQHQPARPVKSSAVEGLTPPRMRTTVGSQEVRPLGRGVSTPMVPRTQRFHSVNTKPVAFSLLPKPKDAQPVGILKKSRAQSKHRPVKKVTFGGNQTREVSRWIGELQGVETASQLIQDGIKLRGRSIHVHPKPDRILGSQVHGWSRTGAMEDHEYVVIFAHRQKGFHEHSTCKADGCNRRDIAWIHNQFQIDWEKHQKDPYKYKGGPLPFI